MNIWHDLNPNRIKEDKFVCYIEIQAGCKNKYELDKETGLLKYNNLGYFIKIAIFSNSILNVIIN